MFSVLLSTRNRHYQRIKRFGLVSCGSGDPTSSKRQQYAVQRANGAVIIRREGGFGFP